MKLPCPEKQLLHLLNVLCHSVEDILLTGMKTANKTTTDKLQMAFREASQMRLLRLGSTLKVAVEEIHRFKTNDASFSSKRLNFFLNRAWMISHGLKQALEKKDEKQWQTLTSTESGKAIKRLEVVTIGVSKRVIKGVFCAFEFRLRSIGNQNDIPHGTALIWSAVFPLKKGTDIEPEAFLHLEQKHTFRPIDLLGDKTYWFDHVMLMGEQAPFRLTLTEQSKVTENSVFDDWKSFIKWDQVQAHQRLVQHEPNPFELDVELQEDIFLRDWTLGGYKTNKIDHYRYYQISMGDLDFHAQVAEDDKTTQKALAALKKQKDKPPLYGLLHYEACQLILQPLSLIQDAKPKQLCLSDKKRGAASLLRSMKF